jgi:hypothetical protein
MHDFSPIPRRKALQIGGLGMLGLTMPKLLSGPQLLSAATPVTRVAPKAKSVIFLYQFGGPSHLDTFDVKPEAPDTIRSKFGTIPSTMPGLRVCELLPKCAGVMDKVTLVHGVYHSMKNHNSASYYALTGHVPPVDDIRLQDTNTLFPAYGSVVDRFLPSDEPTRDTLPRFVSFPYVIRDGSITPGQRATYLGRKHDPMRVLNDPAKENFRLPELSLPAGMSSDRLADRREMQQIVNSQVSWLDETSEAQGLDAHYERALDMLTSNRVRKAFDLAAEPEKIRDGYGRTTYGQSCLLARRLVESGVKFVNVYFSSNIGGRSKTDGGWDTHGFDGSRMYEILPSWQLPQTERTLPTLLTDLEERGLLDTTLVVWMGEFGRTPKVNPRAGRDHYPRAFNVLLAGGGIRGGQVIGSTDESGTDVADRPVGPTDLLQTFCKSLQIDPSFENIAPNGRPIKIVDGGVPVAELFA